MNETWTRFETRVRELKDLDGILGLLSWDEETYSPPRARAARGSQQGTVEAIRHQRLVDPELGDLVSALEAQTHLQPWQKIAVQRLMRHRNLALKVPESLVKATANARSASLDAWQRARRDSNFALFRPHLETMLNLLRERADAIGSKSGLRYDALLDEHEPEMDAETITPVFETLREHLVSLVARIVASDRRPERAFLLQKFDPALQWQFTLELLTDLGFDFERGRQDKSTHPFTGTCADDDVRLTTRIFEDNLLSGIFSTIHECGHGLYEQGFSSVHRGSYLAAAPSMGLHESQSRLYENQIGRSRAFWRFYLPKLKEIFPAQLDSIELDAFYRAVNYVEPSLIRVEADEVTYNLHIMVRFELEKAMLSQDLSVADLPEAWNEKMKSYLGVTPLRDADGCLQDIHWAWGAVGYFPTYAIGNLYAAQLMAAYERENTTLAHDLETGSFGHLLAWLRTTVHERGHEKSARDTIRAAVGADLSVEPFVAYLEAKYRPLYLED